MQVLLLGCLYSPSQHRWDAADPLTRARVCPCGSASPRSGAATWLVKTNFTSTAPAGASPFGIRTCFAKSTDNENKSQKILLISAVKKKQQLLEVSCTGKTMNWNASMALARPITRFLKLSAKSRRGGKVCLSISVAKPVNKSVKPLRYSRSLSHCSLPWRTRWECIRTEQVKTPILDCFAFLFFFFFKANIAESDQDFQLYHPLLVYLLIHLKTAFDSPLGNSSLDSCRLLSTFLSYAEVGRLDTASLITVQTARPETKTTYCLVRFLYFKTIPY